MKHTNKLPTVEVLNKLFIYDEKNGLLKRRESKGNKCAGSVVGVVSTHGHLSVEISGKSYGVHRIIWKMYYGDDPVSDIDHINHDPKDNSIENLRIATVSQNLANSKIYKCNKTGFKGVSETRSGKFRARIRVNSVLLYLGEYKTKFEASSEYRKAANKYFGDFANAN